MTRIASFFVSAVLVLCGWPACASVEPASCRTVRFGLFGYSDIAATTAVAGELLQRLGYEPRALDLSIPVIFDSLAQGGIDVFLGNWMPAQEQNRARFVSQGSIDVVGANLAHAKFTLAVPDYLYAAGLTDFASIQRFAEPLHSTLYGIEPGAAGNRLILGMIKDNAFGLKNFKLVESSEQGMLAELERATQERRPFVFLAWDPHPMNLRFHIHYLTGGDATFGPDQGGATIYTLTRAGYSTLCPNVGRLLHNLKFTLQGESEIMGLMQDQHQTPDMAARLWLAAHPATMSEWLSGVTTFAGNPPAIASASLHETAPSGKLETWMAGHKIPAGDAVTALVNAAKVHGRWFFGTISGVLRAGLDGVTRALELLPTIGLIAAAGFLTGMLRRSWPLAGGVSAALLFILNQGYWQPMLETLSLVLMAALFCALIGIPVGIAAAHRPRLFAMLLPVLDLMQTLPAFVYLIPSLVLFGLGPVPGLIATVIFALPAPIRLTAAGIKAVPSAYIEAGRAFGATSLQLLRKVELPNAAPMILAGMTQCIMLSLSMVVIAALVGAGGLGVPVIRALNSVQVNSGFEAGFAIVVLAIVLDRVLRPAQSAVSGSPGPARRARTMLRRPPS
jgi:glycine betaine/proline transport system substrate-binding protein